VPGLGSTGPTRINISYASTVEAIGGWQPLLVIRAKTGHAIHILADPTGGVYGALCVCSAIYYSS